VIILHAFAPAAAQIRQQATWQRLEQLRRHGRHIVIDWPTHGAQSYGDAIAWCWNRSEQLCLLEHDLVPELEHLVRLELCPHPICMQAYQLHEATVGSTVPVYAFRVLRDDGTLRWGFEGEEFADYFSLGCTRFRMLAMSRLASWSAPDAESWQYLDHWLARASRVAGVRAHIHWPAIQHNHF